MVINNEGQEILYRNGKFVGLNTGYHLGWFFHDFIYNGPEQFKTSVKNKDNPFYGQIIENPKAIQIIEWGENDVLISNIPELYEKLKGLPKEKRATDIYSRIKENNYGHLDLPDETIVVSSWYPGNEKYGGRFYLTSIGGKNVDIIKKLYNEIQKSNVAVSSGYTFMFEDRGLSFIILDQLSKEDLENKKIENKQMSLHERRFLGLDTPDTDEWEFE